MLVCMWEAQVVQSDCLPVCLSHCRLVGHVCVCFFLECVRVHQREGEQMNSLLDVQSHRLLLLTAAPSNIKDWLNGIVGLSTIRDRMQNWICSIYSKFCHNVGFFFLHVQTRRTTSNQFYFFFFFILISVWIRLPLLVVIETFRNTFEEVGALNYENTLTLNTGEFLQHWTLLKSVKYWFRSNDNFKPGNRTTITRTYA